MIIKTLAVVAILLFAVDSWPLLQGWSKGTNMDHVIGLAFLVAFGVAAGWGLRVLGVLFR